MAPSLLWFSRMQLSGYYPGCLVMDNHPRTIVLAVDFWRDPIIPGRPNSADGGFRTFYFRVTMLRSPHGERNKLCKRRGNPGQICWIRGRICPRERQGRGAVLPRPPIENTTLEQHAGVAALRPYPGNNGLVTRSSLQPDEHAYTHQR